MNYPTSELIGTVEHPDASMARSVLLRWTAMPALCCVTDCLRVYVLMMCRWKNLSSLCRTNWKLPRSNSSCYSSRSWSGRQRLTATRCGDVLIWLLTLWCSFVRFRTVVSWAHFWDSSSHNFGRMATKLALIGLHNRLTMEVLLFVKRAPVKKKSCGGHKLWICRICLSKLGEHRDDRGWSLSPVWRLAASVPLNGIW